MAERTDSKEPKEQFWICNDCGWKGSEIKVSDIFEGDVMCPKCNSEDVDLSDGPQDEFD